MFHILEASGERLVVIRSLRQTILRQQLWFPSQKPPLLHTAVGGEGDGGLGLGQQGTLKQVPQTAGLRPDFISTTNINNCLDPKDVANVRHQFL